MDNIDIAGYTDDITPYVSTDTIDEVAASLEQAFITLYGESGLVG